MRAILDQLKLSETEQQDLKKDKIPSESSAEDTQEWVNAYDDSFLIKSKLEKDSIGDNVTIPLCTRHKKFHSW